MISGVKKKRKTRMTKKIKTMLMYYLLYACKFSRRIKWQWQRTGIQLVSGKIEDLCRICQKEKKEP
jgi:hypothetical protein